MNPQGKIHLVVCEGEDDRRVMQALADHAGIGKQLRFEDYANSGNLRAYLKALHARPEFASGAIVSVLVTRDADNDFNQAWQSLRDAVNGVFAVDLTGPGAWANPPAGPRFAGWVIPGPG